MDSEDQAFAIICRCVTTVVVTLIIVIGGYEIHKDYQVAEIVKAGSHPLEASCIYAPMQDNCIIGATKK